MKKLIFTILFLPLITQAQQVQWANKILKYSSDLGGKQHSVKRLLGKPDAFPQGGPSANAWVSKDALANAFVEVEFEHEQAVKQIAVFENLNAGCVSRILVGNGDGKYHTVTRKKTNYKDLSYGFKQKTNTDRRFYFNKKRRKIETAPDVNFNADAEYFILENVERSVKAIKVEFNFALLPGQKQVDAIGISDGEEPIQAKPNLITGSENFSDAEQLIHVETADYDLSSPFIIGDNFYYTISASSKISEIHAINIKNPKETIDVTKKLGSDKTLNYIMGYVPETKTILMGSENRYRTGNESLGFDFFNEVNGAYVYKNPLKIIAYNNYGDYADAFITQDAKHIVFGIESDLTQGGFDLYFTQPKDDGNYSYLQNMGKGLNSAADETNPFILSDNKTIIFASNGYSGYGDFDLYVSIRLDESWKNWSEPKNLGPKVNGQSFETNPFYDENTETLYFVSLRGGISTIQKVKIPIARLSAASH
ncbi:MAG: hypothetical protein EOP55_00295 [Sphingobacteriales bacterium]|nr:MAG: hypothetical protein EOP55_00295 [Sphingobacteriales bacterium]